MGNRILSVFLVMILFLAALPAGSAEETAEFPATFDLRSVDTDGDGIGDRCFVTPVRCQYPFGTCWGFAATAAAETSILSSVLKDDPDAWKTLNLSEKQIVFFSHYYLDDPSSSQNGEGKYSIKVDNAGDIYSGGSTFLATNVYASGIGPVYESRGPEFEYRGKEGTIVQETRPDGLTYDTYAIGDDWMLDESSRFKQDFILKEAYMLSLPMISKYDFTTQETTYTFNEEAVNAIKEQLMQNRAVTVGFHADASRPWEGGEANYMNVDTWAHYTWDGASANHAVAIIGWDDDYSADNFLADHQPPADGAWLVKNSWGSGENEFPYRGRGDWGIPVEKTDENGDIVTDDSGNPVMVGSGYFWLSYYDPSVNEPEAFIFDTSLNIPSAGIISNDKIIRHQYDLLPVGGIQKSVLEDEAKTANIFTADRNEILYYITYEITQENSEASWEVYLLSPGHKTPEDGILIASGEKTHRYGGFYMQEVWPYLTLQEGQTYSIVLTEKSRDGGYVVNMPTSYGKDFPFLDLMNQFGTPQYSVAVINEGESMVYCHGEWVDWSKPEECQDIFGGEAQYESFVQGDGCVDNFTLKGILLENTFLETHIGIAGDPEELVLETGGEPLTLDLELSVTGFEDFPLKEFNVRWELAGGDAACAGLTVSEEGAQAVLSPAESGETWLFVHADGVGTAMIPVRVR